MTTAHGTTDARSAGIMTAAAQVLRELGEHYDSTSEATLNPFVSLLLFEPSPLVHIEACTAPIDAWRGETADAELGAAELLRLLESTRNTRAEVARMTAMARAAAAALDERATW